MGIAVLVVVLLLLAVSVSAECNAPVTINNATDCATLVNWTTLGANLVPRVLSNIFPLGVSTTGVYRAYTTATAYDNCQLTITISLAPGLNQSSICNGGNCSTVYPYVCTCPDDTYGDHCCAPSGYYITNTTQIVCGGNGVCVAGGQCDCNSGYGGLWCCPTASAGVCGGIGDGCCLSNGTCACSNGASGSGPCGGAATTADENGGFTNPDHGAYIALVVVVPILVAIVIVAAVAFMLSSSAPVVLALVPA